MSDIRFNRWLHQSGTGGVYQDSAGNVGIGTSVPTTALDVQGGNLKIGSNTLSSSGVSTFSNISVTGGSITGLSTIGVTTVTATSLSVNGNNYPSSGPLSSRNLIINGAMVVDQRNVGTATTVNGDGFGNRKFPVDRFSVQRNGTVVITAQQDTVAPPDFQNSVKLTVTTADTSVAAADYAILGYRLEGYSAAPLRYGTSDAKQATLSFWVRSSVTGTYCISITNYADNRSQVKEYTINSANTWEYKTITITGDTTGTWEKTTSGGMNIQWTLLSGSDYQNTANTWHSAVELATSSQTQWGSTTSATFYLTGVQLEIGTVGTPFEHKDYGDELARCQRYYFNTWNSKGLANPGSSADPYFGARGRVADVTGYWGQRIFLPTRMRDEPSITIWRADGGTGTAGECTLRKHDNTSTNTTAVSAQSISQCSFHWWHYTGTTVGASGDVVECICHYEAQSEL